MTDGIGRIFGGNSYGVGGYAPRKNEEPEQQEKANNAPGNIEQTPVDPNKIMEFLASNNYFVNPAEGVQQGAEVDAETQDRIAGYMEQFEMIYALIVEEFGEDKAPAVMDIAMDKLMGMAA